MSMIPQIKVEVVLTDAEYQLAKAATSSAYLQLLFKEHLAYVDASVHLREDVYRLLCLSLDHATPRLQHAIFSKEPIDIFVNRGYDIYRAIVNLVDDDNHDVIVEFSTYLACIRESLAKVRKTPPSHYKKVVESQVRFPLSEERLQNIAFAIQTVRDGFHFPITETRQGYANGKLFEF